MARTPKTATAETPVTPEAEAEVAQPAPVAATTVTTITPGAKRVFGPDQCHLRADDGSPACQNPKQPGRNLCRDHEKLWQVAAKARREARLAAAGVTTIPKAFAIRRAYRTRNAAKVTKAAAEADDVPAGNGASRKPKAPHPMKVLSVPVQRVSTQAAVRMTERSS